MNKRGPRLYNALSDEERIARLQRKSLLKAKEIHRVRRNRLVIAFALIIFFLVAQYLLVQHQHQLINSQVQVSQSKVNKLKKQNRALKNEAVNLKNPDYVAKVVRQKLKYSKPGEVIYTIPSKTHKVHKPATHKKVAAKKVKKAVTKKK